MIPWEWGALHDQSSMVMASISRMVVFGHVHPALALAVACFVFVAVVAALGRRSWEPCLEVECGFVQHHACSQKTLRAAPVVGRILACAEGYNPAGTKTRERQAIARYGMLLLQPQSIRALPAAASSLG